MLTAGDTRAAQVGDLPTIELRWTAPDRSVFAVDVAEADLAAFLRHRSSRLVAEGDRLARIARTGLAAEGGPVLNALLLRVPTYVDWVYGWIDGYIAAFRVIGRTAHALATDSRVGGPMASFSVAMRTVASSELARLVVTPVRPEERMTGVLVRMDRILADEWRRILDRDQQRRRDLLRAHAGSVRRAPSGAKADTTGCSVPPPIASGADLDTAALAAAAVGAQTELYVWRVTRPFATRLGALATRLAVGGATLTGGGIMGFGNAGTGGAALAWFATASGFVWSVDYGLNLLDDVLHRNLLSAQVAEALAAAMVLQEQTLSAHVAAGVDAAVAELARCGSKLGTTVAYTR
jgi:hypothetical protein